MSVRSKAEYYKKLAAETREAQRKKDAEMSRGSSSSVGDAAQSPSKPLKSPKQWPPPPRPSLDEEPQPPADPPAAAQPDPTPTPDQPPTTPPLSRGGHSLDEGAWDATPASTALGESGSAALRRAASGRAKARQPPPARHDDDLDSLDGGGEFPVESS